MSTRKKPPLPHPIAKAIEDVFAAGHTPRVHVDARRSDVTVPDHVRERWQARLVIDLDPSWPLRLEHTTEGLCVDLAFSGLVSRCVFGWSAIYVVLDRATGRGTVIESHLPAHELPPGLGYISAAPTPLRAAPVLKAVPTVVPHEPVPDDEAKASATKASEAAEAAPPPKKRRSRRGNAAEAMPPEDEPPGQGPPEPPSSEAVAKERRARFRVIEGGS